MTVGELKRFLSGMADGRDVLALIRHDEMRPNDFRYISVLDVEKAQALEGEFEYYDDAHREVRAVVGLWLDNPSDLRAPSGDSPDDPQQTTP